MKNLSKFILGALSVAVLATGCKKLDETPYDFYSPENLYKTQADAEAAIAGVYSDFNSYDFFTKPYWEFLSEDDDHMAGPSWALSSTGSGNYPDDYKTDHMYSGPYVVISRANSVLERIPAIEMDPVVKNRILGEARFMRAWAYFTLTRLYGPVPLRIKSVATLADTNIPRAAIADVYAQIITDLTEAENLMPYQDGAGAGAPGHANKGAAQALLTKVYLTMASGSLQNAQLTVQGGRNNTFTTYTKAVVAGYEGFDSRAYYQKAKDEAAKLMASNKYSLFPDYMDLWTKANDNQVEHIFMAQTLPNSPVHTNFVSAYFTSPDRGGRGYLFMDGNFYHTFRYRTDVRILKGVTHQWFEHYGGTNGPFYRYYPREDSVLYRIVSIVPLSAAHPVRLRGDTVFANYDNTPRTTKYYVPGKPAAPNNNESPDAINYPLLRYADVLLMFAEAETELNGNTATGRGALLQVRRRSNPTLALTDPYFTELNNFSQVQLRSAIFAERDQELFFESNRRFDLQRWGVWLPVMNAIGVSKQNVVKTRLPRTLLIPLPNTEVLSSSSIGQNPGW